MQMKRTVACLVAGLIAATAAAQTPIKPAVRLATPPAMQKAAPTLSGAQFDIVAAEKISAIAQWGLTITKANMKPSYWLTPQAAAHANGAVINFSSTSPAGGPNFAGGGIFPYGNIPLQMTPTGSDYVMLGNIPATSRDWFFVECLVGGNSGFGMGAKPQLQPGHPAGFLPTVMYRELSSNSKNRVSALFAPTTEARRTFEIRRFNTEGVGDWRWGGCEVTPIQL